MRRIVCTAYGPPANLEVHTEPDPDPGPGQVVVAVEAAGVAYVDALFVLGTYQIKVPPPFTPGWEAAGHITAVGDGVQGWQVGDRVLAMTMGCFASHVVLPARVLVRIPDGLDAARAASLIGSYCTMWFAFTHRAPLMAGQTVLVLGAGGGIGLAAIDVAKSFGARVIAAASSPAKLEAARAAGADEVIDYSTEDLKARAKELSPGGVDVVVDPVGGDLADPALRSLGWDGRYLVIGFAGGSIPKLAANLVLLNSRTVIGVDWGAWAGRNRAGQDALLAEVLAKVAAGELHPPAPAEEPLDSAGAVLQRALDRQLVGKVVLVP